jgi:aryl-alcohol dehydrogenase-like predicted oxidoreductase
MKISLGTVQFGVTYGAFNTRGQIPMGEINDLLSLAKTAGVAMLDTALAYGEAEKLLGALGAPSSFQIVTKCPSLSAKENPVTALQSAFEDSLANLGVNQVYGYLLHNAEDILIPGVFGALKELRYSGRVKNIGVSGYDIYQAQNFCNYYSLDIVQLPANVLDPWYDSVNFPEFVEVHVRSVFLQGFLLSNPTALPKHLMQFSNVLAQFRAEAAAQGLTPLQAALAPLLASPRVAKVIVGTDRLSQLTEILQAEKTINGLASPILGPYENATSSLTDPRKWRNLDD